MYLGDCVSRSVRTTVSGRDVPWLFTNCDEGHCLDSNADAHLS
jgi:hypothetical protein